MLLLHVAITIFKFNEYFLYARLASQVFLHVFLNFVRIFLPLVEVRNLRHRAVIQLAGCFQPVNGKDKIQNPDLPEPVGYALDHHNL